MDRIDKVEERAQMWVENIEERVETMMSRNVVALATKALSPYPWVKADSPLMILTRKLIFAVL